GAAVQHELGIAADEARGVDAQRQIAADAVTGIAVDRRLRLAVDPAAFHRRAPSRARKTSAARGADGRPRIEMTMRSAFAEHTLAPPAGTAGASPVGPLPPGPPNPPRPGPRPRAGRTPRPTSLLPPPPAP